MGEWRFDDLELQRFAGPFSADLFLGSRVEAALDVGADTLFGWFWPHLRGAMVIASQEIGPPRRLHLHLLEGDTTGFQLCILPIANDRCVLSGECYQVASWGTYRLIVFDAVTLFGGATRAATLPDQEGCDAVAAREWERRAAEKALGRYELFDEWLDLARAVRAAGMAPVGYAEYLVAMWRAELAAEPWVCPLPVQGQGKAPTPAVEVAETRPWDAIPPGRDREMVRLLHEGYTNPEIADELKRMGYAPVIAKTVANDLARLRKAHGLKAVPHRGTLSRKSG